VTADELKSALLRCLEAARSDLPREELPALIGELAAIQAVAFARIAAPIQASQNHDELLGIDEASRRLGMSRDYLYRHKSQFPFTRHQGPKCKLLFSAQGIERHIQQKGKG